MQLMHSGALKQTPDILYQRWSLSCCGGNKPGGILVQRAKHGVSGAVDTELTVNYSYSGPR